MIEKLDKFTIKQQRGGFTTFLNSVLQNIHDADVLGMYVYLSTLPADWDIRLNHIKAHFKIGRDKAYKILNKLQAMQLITYDQVRKEDGSFSKNIITVTTGEKFLRSIIDQKTVDNSKSHNSHEENNDYNLHDNCTNTDPHTGLPYTGLPYTGFQDTVLYITNKTINKLNINNICPVCKNNDQCSCDSKLNKPKKSKGHLEYTESFETFYSSYPRREGKRKAFEVWQRDNLELKLEEILKNISERLDAGDWKDVQYIPMPRTYLNNERWTDEVKQRKSKEQNYDSRKLSAFEQAMRSVSTEDREQLLKQLW